MEEKVNKKLIKAVWEKLFNSLDDLHDEVKYKLEQEKKRKHLFKQKMN